MSAALRRDLGLILVCALGVNALAAIFVTRPGYMDAYYYFGGALQLARGRGFSEPYVWNYLGPDRSLPQPSHLYWMPLTSIVAAPFIALADEPSDGNRSNSALFRVAQIPFVVLASLLPLLSYGVAISTTRARRHAVGAAALTLFSGYYFGFWPNTDAFALYALVGGGALLAAGRASQTPGRAWWVASGLGAGLAHLTRADGPLLLAVILLAAALHPGRPDGAGKVTPLARLNCGLVAVAAYGVIVLPWVVRNIVVVGAPFAPGAWRVLWLTEYNDLFNFPAATLTAERYLAGGWAGILAGKWSAFLTNLGTLIGAQGMVLAFPFAVLGLWRLRRHPMYVLALRYGLLLYAVMTLFFTFPGARGGLFHSGAALLPFIFPAALAGLDVAVEAASRRMPHWQPERSKPVFAALLVALAIGLTLLLFRLRVIGDDWRRPAFGSADEVYREIGGWLADDCGGPGCEAEVVAVNNPPGFYYFAHRPSIMIPNGGPDTLVEAMGAYGARWAVLDVNRPPALAGLFAAPHSDPRLALRAAFNAGSEPVYLFELRDSAVSP